MNTRTQTYNSFETNKKLNKNSEIIYFIVLNDIDNLTNLLTEKNVNNIIDEKNKYTALHYAIQLNNDKIINFLLNIHANPYLKTNDGLDAFDLSLKYQTKVLFNTILKNEKNEKEEVIKTVSNLEKKIATLDINNKYLTKSLDDMILKNDILRKEIITIKNKNNTLVLENNNLQSSKVSLEEKYHSTLKKVGTLKNDNSLLLNDNNLIKEENKEVNSKFNNLKRKYDELNDSYDGLLQKIKK
jgi:ankyrin repeat protein